MEKLDIRQKDVIMNTLSVISLILIILSVGLALNNPGSEYYAVNFASVFTGLFISFYFYKGYFLYNIFTALGSVVLANILLRSFISSLSPEFLYNY